jgi:hypothetical protein
MSLHEKEGSVIHEAFSGLSFLRQGLTRKSPARGGIAAKDPVATPAEGTQNLVNYLRDRRGQAP